MNEETRDIIDDAVSAIRLGIDSARLGQQNHAVYRLIHLQAARISKALYPDADFNAAGDRLVQRSATQDVAAKQVDDKEKKIADRTFGERRVRSNFNPSSNVDVTIIKDLSSQLITFLEEIKTGSDDDEVKRLAALAQTSFEEGCMWAVKAVT